MTVADARLPHARLAVFGAGVAAGAAILWLTRTYLFYFDEWTFITSAPAWTFATWFEPHNAHPSMLFRAVYWLLLNTVGLRSYVPYMFVTVGLHLLNVVLMFELVRRRSGELTGLGAALLLLFLGAGWEDILWAFQMAWLASTALGLAALLVASDGRRIVLPALLIAASLGFSGVGVPFAVALGVQVLLTPARRRQVWWLAGVAAVYAAWYVAFGHNTIDADRPSLANLPGDLPYALWGLAQSAAALIGEGGWLGIPLLVAAVLAIGWRWARHGADAFGVGIAAGLLAFYLVTGLTRGQMGWQQAGASRYDYVGALLWLVLLGDAARGLPWRGTWRPALAAVVFLACFNSAVLLFEFTAAKTVQMQREAADLQALAAERGDPCLDPAGHPDLLVMPQVLPELYYRAVDHYGDPVAGLRVTDRADFEAARANLRKAGC